MYCYLPLLLAHSQCHGVLPLKVSKHLRGQLVTPESTTDSCPLHLVQVPPQARPAEP